MNAESLIKNGIAEHTVALLLEESGYDVMRIAREGHLVGIPRSFTRQLRQSDSAGKLTTAPSLAVFDKTGKEALLVKVKYRSTKSAGRNISHGIKQLVEYWPEAILVLVTLERPHFRAVISDDGEEKAFEEVFSKVRKTTIASYGKTVLKFLGV